MRRLLVICALVAVGLAGTALARRPATDAERSAMASAIGFPPACVTAFVSTVDENWGKVAPTNASGCPMADGFSVVHDKAGTWSQAWAGSDSHRLRAVTGNRQPRSWFAAGSLVAGRGCRNLAPHPAG